MKSRHLNLLIPGAVIPSFPDRDGGRRVFITTTSSQQSFYVLISDPTRSGERQADPVHIDTLAICKSN